MNRLIILGTALVWLAQAGGADAVEPKPRTADFVAMAAMSDMFEIESSELAQQKTSGPTKDFAAHMIADHQKTSSELKGLVASGSVKAAIPTALDSVHQGKLDSLEKLDGVEFIKAYDGAQVKAHKAAVELFEAYSKEGDNAALKQWAAQTLPTLKSHLVMAEHL